MYVACMMWWQCSTRPATPGFQARCLQFSHLVVSSRRSSFVKSAQSTTRMACLVEDLTLCLTMCTVGHWQHLCQDYVSVSVRLAAQARGCSYCWPIASRPHNLAGS